MCLSPSICARVLLAPFTSLKRTKRQAPPTDAEHWHSPIPGTYQHIPGRGWYLIHRDEAPIAPSPEKPEQVIYCRILRRYILASEMERRCKWYRVELPDDATGSLFQPTLTERTLSGSTLAEPGQRRRSSLQRQKTEQMRFFQLDDGVGWVAGWDKEGRSLPGPYRKWCFDKDSKSMRPMRSAEHVSNAS